MSSKPTSADSARERLGIDFEAELAKEMGVKQPPRRHKNASETTATNPVDELNASDQSEQNPAPSLQSVEIIDHMGHRARIRQRLLTTDGHGMNDYELLEVLLCAFIPRRDVKPLAKALLRQFKSLSACLAASVEDLRRVKGMGETAAIYLRSVHLLQTRAALEPARNKPILSNWNTLIHYCKLNLQHNKREQFRVLFLNTKNELLADEKLWEGTINQAPVYPREIGRRALEWGAKAVILVHNHPTGDPKPSRADIEITREIDSALYVLGIDVHDHIIIGRNGVTSFKSQNLL